MGAGRDGARLDGIVAVLFDMDGTLVLSDAAVARAWRTWATEFGVDGDRAIADGAGRPAHETVATLLPWLSPAEAKAAGARQLQLQYGDLDDVIAAPGAREVIRAVEEHNRPWAVVTSADATLAGARLAAAGLAPPLTITSDDIGRGKPDPEGFLTAAGRLGVDITRCLVVEDSSPGASAGRRAGAVVAALNEVEGDLAIGDLGELAELLRRHWRHPDVVVVPSAADDVPAWRRLARLVEPEFGASMADDAGWNEALRARVERGSAWTARSAEHDEMLGGMWLQAGETALVIRWLAVFPEHRRHGVGSALVAAALDSASGLPTEVVTFGDGHQLTDAAHAARRLYARHGFEQISPDPPAGPDGTPRVRLRHNPR